MLFQSENVTRRGGNASTVLIRPAKTKIRLASKNVPRKGGNVFIERKRHKHRLKSVSRAKTHINERIRVYIAKPFLPRENDASKSEKAFAERKHVRVKT